MKGKLTHDSHTKKFMSNKENAVAFLEAYLPREVLEQMDLSRIRVEDKSFVGKKNRKYHSDLLYTVPGEKGDIHFYILFEHKSYHDKKIFPQLLNYLALVYQWQIDQKIKRNVPITQLDVVIPFVFYHGEKDWNLGKNFSEYFPISEKSELSRFIPGFEILLFHLKENTELPDSFPFALYYNLQVMQIIRKNREVLISWLTDLVELLEKKGETEMYAEVFRGLIDYLEGSLGDRKEIIQMVKKKKESFFMGVFAEMEAEAIERGLKKGMEQGIQQGMEKGIQQGIEKGIEKGIKQGIEQGMEQGMEKGEKQKAIQIARSMKEEGDSLEKIARVTGLSLEELDKVL